MSDSNNDNKVVQFPSHKVKPVKTRGSEVMEKARHSQRWTMAMSLVLTLFLASYLSLELNKNSQVVVNQVVSRGIASEGSDVAVNGRSFDEEMVLAKQISKDSLRDPASVGRRPSSRDELTFVLLNSQYLVQDQGGKIVQIQFPEKTDAKPVFAPPRLEFFAKYQSILRIPEGEPVLKDEHTQGNYKIEVYEIKGSDNLLTQVQFRLDVYGHLYEMKIKDPARDPARE